MELVELKSRVLKLLREDEEFRYAVAGLIGLDEVLKRLDRHEEELVKLREDINRLREDMIEGFKRHDEEMARLREDFNRALQAIDKRFEVMDRRLMRVERTLEKLTVDVEDEARSIIRYRLREELGLDIELGSLVLPDLEIDIFGVADDLCVIGEATVRGGVSVLDKLLEKAEVLRSRYPDKLRPKTIMVIYVSLALPELVDEARKRGVWLLKATGDYYKPDLTTLISNMHERVKKFAKS
ncbi:hypothetical protein [Infirmifilum sp. NZ]|uniref:hypothetical protein n=1 Tax=Infirmifilum sp. NZ TaxID=2926850 RepID=UPI0027A4C5AD|nr:hypothetical protein [Infirmifilum sp. NZ]UNQ73167.1 hypothetical protein MOV14_08650 [Infirmifilum sp. NZ]